VSADLGCFHGTSVVTKHVIAIAIRVADRVFYDVVVARAISVTLTRPAKFGRFVHAAWRLPPFPLLLIRLKSSLLPSGAYVRSSLAPPASPRQLSNGVAICRHEGAWSTIWSGVRDHRSVPGASPTGLPLADLIATEMAKQSLTLHKMAHLVRRQAKIENDYSAATPQLVCKWRLGQVTPGRNHTRLLAQVLNLPVEAVARAAQVQRDAFLKLPTSDMVLVRDSLADGTLAAVLARIEPSRRDILCHVLATTAAVVTAPGALFDGELWERLREAGLTPGAHDTAAPRRLKAATVSSTSRDTVVSFEHLTVHYRQLLWTVPSPYLQHPLLRTQSWDWN
jgi:hypothetical protein